MKKSLILSVLILFLSAGVALAAPVQWSVNGHYYERIDDPVTWDEARAQADAMTYNGIQGHLVTITSAEENLFLTYNPDLGNGEPVAGNELINANLLHVHWMGGYQPAGSAEPAGGWSWVTGEPFAYNNWAEGGEPNNYGGDEKYIGFDHGFSADGKQWNDLPALLAIDDPNTIYIAYIADGFVVEYDTAAVPEPATMLLLGLGLLGLVPIKKKI